MAKLTRLFRVENIYGQGAYQNNKNLATSVSIIQRTDREEWSLGRRRQISYHDRSGVKHVFNRNSIDIRIDTYTDSRPEQLNMFPTEIEPKPWWGTPIFCALTKSQLCSEMEPNYLPDFEVGIKTQMELDVEIPEQVIRRLVIPGCGMTMADLICVNVHGSTSDARFRGQQPLPDNDGLGDPHPDYHYAFGSLAQMEKWFDAKPKDILQAGAVIRVLDVKEVKRGGSQVIYLKRDVVKEFTLSFR